MHGKDAAGDELSMLADAEMPRLYSHHVVEHELQVEPPLHTHLGRAQGQAQAVPTSPSLDPLGTHCCTLGHPASGLPLPAMRLGTSQNHEPTTAPWDRSHHEGTLDQGTRGRRSSGRSRYLGEHGFAVLGDHGALVTVQRDEVVVEGLLGVLEHVVELRGPPFKDAAEVTRNQSPADRWSRRRRKIMSVNLAHPDMPWGCTGRGFPSSRWLEAAEL